VASACQLAKKGKNRSALDKLGGHGIAARSAVDLKSALQPQLATVASGLKGDKQEDEVRASDDPLDIKGMVQEDRLGSSIVNL